MYKQISLKKVTEALKRTKNGESSGCGDISIALVKYRPNILWEHLIKGIRCSR